MQVHMLLSLQGKKNTGILLINYERKSLNIHICSKHSTPVVDINFLMSLLEFVFVHVASYPYINVCTVKPEMILIWKRMGASLDTFGILLGNLVNPNC